MPLVEWNYKTTGYLISLHAKLNNDHRSISVKFVVRKEVSHDCLLSLADYRRLLDQDSEPNKCSDAVLAGQTVDSCQKSLVISVESNSGENDKFDAQEPPDNVDAADALYRTA